MYKVRLTDKADEQYAVHLRYVRREYGEIVYARVRKIVSNHIEHLKIWPEMGRVSRLFGVAHQSLRTLFCLNLIIAYTIDEAEKSITIIGFFNQKENYAKYID